MCLTNGRAIALWSSFVPAPRSRLAVQNSAMTEGTTLRKQRCVTCRLYRTIHASLNCKLPDLCPREKRVQNCLRSYRRHRRGSPAGAPRRRCPVHSGATRRGVWSRLGAGRHRTCRKARKAASYAHDVFVAKLRAFRNASWLEEIFQSHSVACAAHVACVERQRLVF